MFEVIVSYIGGSRTAWATEDTIFKKEKKGIRMVGMPMVSIGRRVSGQPGIYNETLSSKNKDWWGKLIYGLKRLYFHNLPL